MTKAERWVKRFLGEPEPAFMTVKLTRDRVHRVEPFEGQPGTGPTRIEALLAAYRASKEEQRA